MRILSRPAAVVLAAGTLASAIFGQTERWDKSITVEIRAPEHKADGKTWDVEVPVLVGPVMPNAGNPAPDMMLCIVDGSGGQNCIHDSKRNHFGVPYSICQDQYVCSFTNVKVPGKGYYGVLVIDLDVLPSRQDYMLAAILRNGGPAEPREAWKIEKAIKSLEQNWHVVGAPDEFPESDASLCTPKDPCFGDSRGGVPSLSIGEQEVKACGMPITGRLQYTPARTGGMVTFAFQVRENECPGSILYRWDFGDGRGATTSDASVSHVYAHDAEYEVSVTPRCERKTSVCDASQVAARVTAGR
jgi:hypothetical protein